MIPGIFAQIVHHPLSYQAGPLQFTGFGLAMLLTFVIAQIISQHEMERRGHDGSVMSDLVFAAVIGGLLGAKLYYAVLMGDLKAARLSIEDGATFVGKSEVTPNKVALKQPEVSRPAEAQKAVLGGQR